MTRPVRIWARLFTDIMNLSWQRAPGLTLAAWLSLFGNVAATGGAALALRAAKDATSTGQLAAGVAGAAGAAAAYGLLVVARDITDALILAIADQVGRRDIHPQIHRDLATLEGLEHLERSEYLDRVTLVSKSGGRLAAGAWNGLKAVAAILGLVLMILLLGGVSPWLLALPVFAALPIWFDHRGQLTIQRADIATAEPYRLQQHLFDLCVSPVSGKELRVAAAGPELTRRQRDSWRAAMSARARAQYLAGAWTVLGWTIFVAAFTGGLALAARQVAGGHGSAGDLVLLVTIAATLRACVQSAVDSTTATASARQHIGPYLWLRDYAARARAGRSGAAAPPGQLSDGICLEHVSFRYPDAAAPALDDITVRFPAGSVVAIVGEYGSGKSTLVKLLGKFYQPETGRITVDGTDLADLNTEEWRLRCTAAFQDFGRFHTAFRQNVGLGDLPALDDETRIRSALDAAGAGQLAGELPDGLGTLLGTQLGGIELSEGQWQRAALARASMRTSPLLLILDEPTASLDAPSEQAIVERYMDRARDCAARLGTITVIVSHRFATVTGADLIMVLDHGRITESGSHAELLARDGSYAELYGIQVSAYRKFRAAARPPGPG